MMRIRRPAAADEARLLDHVSDVLAVTNATRFGKGEDALVDLPDLSAKLGSPSAAGRIKANLAANAPSTCWASVADNWFFVGKRRWAQSATVAVIDDF